MPNVRAVHVDRPLSNISVRYANAAFIGEIMFPPVKVAKESDKYFVYGKEHYARHGTLRADGAEANEFNWTVDKETYSCEEYALKTPVTDREKANADAPIKPFVDATEMLTDAIKLDWEVRFQTLATTAGSYAAGHAAAATTQYNDHTNGTFQADVLTGQEVIRRSAQKYPSHIFIPSRVAMHVAQNSTIMDLVKYTHNNLLDVPGGSWVLPKTIWGMKVVVMMAVQNTANLAQAETLSDIWGDQIIMAYIEPSPGIKKISWGYTFQSRPWQTKRWREEKRSSDLVEVSVVRDAEIVCTSCGYRITDTLATAYE